MRRVRPFRRRRRPAPGGFLISGGFELNAIFYVLAGLGLLGLLLTLLVPTGRRELHSTLIEPTRIEPTPYAVKP